MTNWVRRQPTKEGFTMIINKSNFKKSMLLLACKMSGEYKTPKKKLKIEGTRSRKYEYLFRLSGYIIGKKTNGD